MILISAMMPISRRYRSDCMFERPCIKGTKFIDTVAGRYNSLDNNCNPQVFYNDYLFAAAYPMEKKSLAGQGLREFISDFGVMDRLVCDGSKDQTSKGTDFMKEVGNHGIDLHVTKTD